MFVWVEIRRMMFEHPFLISFGIATLSAFIRVIFFQRSFLGFLDQILRFPFWAVVFVHALAYFVRSVRESYLYRLARTIHTHNQSSVRIYPVQADYSTSQPDEFGLDTIQHA